MRVFSLRLFHWSHDLSTRFPICFRATIRVCAIQCPVLVYSWSYFRAYWYRFVTLIFLAVRVKILIIFSYVRHHVFFHLAMLIDVVAEFGFFVFGTLILSSSLLIFIFFAVVELQISVKLAMRSW